MKKLVFIFLAFTLVSCSNSKQEKLDFLNNVKSIQKKRDILNDNKYSGDYEYNYDNYQILLIETQKLETIENYPTSETLKELLITGINKDINEIKYNKEAKNKLDSKVIDIMILLFAGEYLKSKENIYKIIETEISLNDLK